MKYANVPAGLRRLRRDTTGLMALGFMSFSGGCSYRAESMEIILGVVMFTLIVRWCCRG